MLIQGELKTQLAHTWPVVFARHGNFTAVQQQAIPPILAGHNTLVIAATASGKTEAVIAPLLERLLQQKPPEGELRLLYICPTRALVRDLYERLLPIATALKLSLAMKTGDTGPLTTVPALLLTTPESTDSLLTRTPRLFATLDAIVLDEIHLFDGEPRGDHLRCLLARIEWIRQFANPNGRFLHRIALSATIPDPAGVAGRYLPHPTIIEVAGGRQIHADMIAMMGLADLVIALAQRPSPKTLIFCNSRNEVEQTAAFLRQHLPYETAVFSHYSNLDKKLRQEVEADFAAATVAVCVATSTLELGIDIGSIDEVALIGPPPTLTSFLQRIGRGSRRSNQIQVLCLARSPLEEIRFTALLAMAEAEMIEPEATYSFLPSVLVQQTFSLLKQSPAGSLRLADLRRIAPAEVADETIRQILAQLVKDGFLQKGRLGEWLPGRELQPLFDNHDLYSNIGSERMWATVLDAYSGKPLAQMERPRRKGETLLMGGRPMRVKWHDRYKFAVEQGNRDDVEETLRFVTAPFAVPLAEAQGIAAWLGIPSGQIPMMLDAEGVWLFHFWGGVYGALLTAVLQAHHPAALNAPHIRPQNDLCLRVPFALATLPPWDEQLVEREARHLSKRLTPLLELGRFHSYLPQELAQATLVQKMDIGRFGELYRNGRLFPVNPQNSDLRSLL